MLSVNATHGTEPFRGSSDEFTPNKDEYPTIMYPEIYKNPTAKTEIPICSFKHGMRSKAMRPRKACWAEINAILEAESDRESLGSLRGVLHLGEKGREKKREESAWA